MLEKIKFSNRFICHLWKITKRSQSSVLLSSSVDTAFIPTFPPDKPTGDYYVFGTALSQAQNGGEYYNANCGDTVYWRSQVAINNTLTPALSSPGSSSDLYYYIGASRSRLIAISQSDYNAGITSALSDLSKQLNKRFSSNCYSVTGQKSYTGTPLTTKIVYANPVEQSAYLSLLNSYPKLQISYFELGQQLTTYGIECEWDQSVSNNSYSSGTIYQSDRVGNLQGKIQSISVYITNGQYAYSVIHNNGQVTEPIYITKNGNPIYANNYPGGDVAIALLGIKNVICKRIDNQTDTGGNLVNLNPGFVESITPIGLTDHDRPIFYGGISYLPYYGGSAADYEYSAKGEGSTSEAEFAIALEGISEAELVAGVYDGAELITYYYDWGNQTLISQDAPGYFGKIKIHNSRNKAYKFTVEFNSIGGLLQLKESNIITSYCSHDFGGADCGVNLIARGLVDTLTVQSVSGGQTVIVDSPRPNNYYGKIEFAKNGIIYAHLIAKYTASSLTLESWDTIIGLEPGDTIKAIARCDKTSADCLKFQGNKLRFGGFENIPKETDLRKIRN